MYVDVTYKLGSRPMHDAIRKMVDGPRHGWIDHCAVYSYVLVPINGPNWIQKLILHSFALMFDQIQRKLWNPVKLEKGFLASDLITKSTECSKLKDVFINPEFIYGFTILEIWGTRVQELDQFYLTFFFCPYKFLVFWVFLVSWTKCAHVLQKLKTNSAQSYVLKIKLDLPKDKSTSYKWNRGNKILSKILNWFEQREGN